MSVLAHTVAVDPLIAEAKQRARRRRLLALGAVALVAAATAVLVKVETRASTRALGICATARSGWREERVPKSIAPQTVLLTNFHFGRVKDLDGLTDPRLNWPRSGALIALYDMTSRVDPFPPGHLPLLAGSFHAFEGARWPVAYLDWQIGARVAEAYVELRHVTPATVAAANQALAGVRVCSV